MFKTTVSSTPLVSDAANAYFQNTISGNSFCNDWSFLSTLRAILPTRLKDEEHIYLSFTSTNYSEETLEGLDKRDALNAVFNGNLTNHLSVHTFSDTSPSSNQAWLKLVETHFEREYSGWHRIEKVTQFFKKVFCVLCFVNPDIRSVAIFTEMLDMRRLHYLQCGIPAYLPWFFESEGDDIPITEDEMALIDSLRQKTQEQYDNCIAKIAEKYDFETARVKQLLAGFEVKYERVRCGQIKRAIENCIRDINNYNESIGQVLKNKLDYENQLLGLETKIAQAGEDSEIMEYFLCNKHLLLKDVYDTDMIFVVKDYLTYFDEEMATHMIDNESSFVYKPNGRGCNNYIPAEDMKLLMTAVFLEQKIRIRFCAAYKFSINGNVGSLTNFPYGAECREYMPNTHIDRYGCMGNYVRTINNLLQKHDYIGAIEQCIASCKSLNFADSAVMCEFMRQLYGIADYAVNIKCFELPDGRVVKPKEAIAYLKEAENNG